MILKTGRETDGGSNDMRMYATALVTAALAGLALPAAVSATPAHHHGSTGPAFYANDGRGDLVRVTVTGGRAQVARLAFEPSPVWWRPFYLTPNSATGSWVVGTFRGDQHDTTDNSRLFAYNGTTRRVQWLTAWAAGNQSPVVDAAKVPDVYYVSGTTVREVSTSAIGDHRIFTAPTGWQITGLTVAGTAAPYVALTHNEGASPLTATTEVEQLTSTPTVVVPITHGTVTALALSPDGRSLAMSLVSPSGGSTLSLRAVAHGGIHRTLPAVGNTTQMSWDTSGDTLAVNPQQWGGTTLVNLTTAMTSYPSALQPYGADVLIP
ncbi:MAG TPA: hypothetical protein VHW92_02365 [Mycobacteriales bacterium]|nr:hypothetical protein [Mycobacteriales bacterium]